MDENNNEELKTNENVETTNLKEETNQTEDKSQKSVNVCGLLSFVFSIVGIFVYGIICGIIATILGIVGLATFKSEKHTSRWMAITGLVIGVVEVVIMGLYIISISYLI